MENSLKGILVAVTLVGLFTWCIIQFIVLFPQNQGESFSGSAQDNYLVVNSTDINNEEQLVVTNNESENAFNEWDITQGQMGSNKIKQGQGGISGYFKTIYSSLRIMAIQVFGANSPVVYALLIFSTLASGYIVYQIIKFIRIGE